MSLDLTIKGFSLENARELAAHAKLAYTLPPTIMARETKTQVIVRDAGNCLLVGFPGTHDFRDVLTDLEAWMVSVLQLGNAKLHHGFFEAWTSIAKQLHFHLSFVGVKPVVFYGHSLGGAVAVIAAKAMRDLFIKVHSVYVFGCPGVGDEKFQSVYNETRLTDSSFETLGDATFCLINDCDIIPRLPIADGDRRFHRPGHDLLMSSNRLREDPNMLWRLKSDLRSMWKVWRAYRNPECVVELLAVDHYMEHYIQALAAVKTKKTNYEKKHQAYPGTNLVPQ